MGSRQAARRVGAAILVVIAVGACGQTTDAAIELVAAPTAAQILETHAPQVVLLDVRTADEFAQAHVPGARNIDVRSPAFASLLEQLDKAAPYVIYCQSGNRSARAVTVMRDLGFTEVWEVAGGIEAWEKAGLPIDS